MTSLPVGSIVSSASVAGNDIKQFLACDGSAYDRMIYSALFEVIGESYGDGDGETTFNVPTLFTMSLPDERGVALIKHQTENSDTCGVQIFKNEALWTVNGVHHTDIYGKVQLASNDIMIPIETGCAGNVICKLLRDRVDSGKLSHRAMRGINSRPNVSSGLCGKQFVARASKYCLDKLLELDPSALDVGRVKRERMRYSDVNRGFILHFLDTEKQNVFERHGLGPFREIYDLVARCACTDACNAHSVNVLVTLPNLPSIGWHTDHTLELWADARPADCPIPEHVSVLYLMLPDSGSPTEICTKEGVQRYGLNPGDVLTFDGSLIHRVKPFTSANAKDIRVTFVIEHYHLPADTIESVTRRSYLEKPDTGCE